MALLLLLIDSSYLTKSNLYFNFKVNITFLAILAVWPISTA